MLLKQMKDQPARRSGRRMLVLALAGATILATMTAAGYYTRWSQTAATRYQATERQKLAAEKSGLSTMLEEPAPQEAASTQAAPAQASSAPAVKPAAGPITSATDKGITITAVQTLVDQYYAHLIFRVEGFDALPEGEQPCLIGGLTKMPCFSIPGDYYPGDFFSGVHYGSYDEEPTYSDGTPVQYDADGQMIYRWRDTDGSMEFTITAPFPYGTKAEDIQGGEVTVEITGLGMYDGLEEKPLVEGDWKLAWNLTCTSESKSVTNLNFPLGKTGFTVMDAELTPISVVYTLGGDLYKADREAGTPIEDCVPTSPRLMGVRMKDGTVVECLPTCGGMYDLGANVTWFDETVPIMDVNRVSALLFADWDNPSRDGPRYVEVPVK